MGFAPVDNSGPLGPLALVPTGIRLRDHYRTRQGPPDRRPRRNVASVSTVSFHNALFAIVAIPLRMRPAGVKRTNYN
jgi:hypothetical protein